jgi:hypothetical protein
MAGQRENVVGFGVALQPTPGIFVQPVAADLIPISSPDNGSDPNKANDPTLTSSIFSAPAPLISLKGRAGATAALRGPGGTAPFAAGAWPIGRILMAAAFSELINATAITATAQAGASASQIVLASTASAVDDFYNGMIIQHANIGTGAIRGSSIIRDYNGTTKVADLEETLGTAISGGTYTIPPQVTYVLGQGASIPLLSVSVWRDLRRYDYSDCALTSFALNIPVANDQGQDLPSIEFAMSGIPILSTDTVTPSPSNAQLLPPPSARDGKFAFAGLKIGHQSLRLEFGLTTGAPPNQNFATGQESYQVLSGTRSVSLDLNQVLKATLDLETLVANQQAIPMMAGWGVAPGNRFFAGIPNSVLDPFSPNGRNGFVGLTGNANPSDVDRSASLSLTW